MANLPTALPARLDALLDAVLAIENSLENDGVLPDQFLQDNNIRVIAHDFENTDSETEQTPPILFKPRPGDFLDKYPVNPSLIKDPSHRNQVMHYLEYGESTWKDDLLGPGKPNDPARLGDYAEASARYLRGWAYGQIPRTLGYATRLFSIVGIHPVVVGNGLYARDTCYRLFQNSCGQKYSSYVHEYESEKHGGVKPHLILLGTQENKGHENSMMCGELLLLLTAMRNRAHQTSLVEDSDSETEASTNDEKGPPFKDENKFPVLMISIVRPQHGRIFYACMDGSDLVIRQSKLYSLEKKNEKLLDFFSCYLLSSPLDEPQARPAVTSEALQPLERVPSERNPEERQRKRRRVETQSSGSSDKENRPPLEEE